MSNRTTTVKRARKAGRATPKGGFFQKIVDKTVQERALDQARREARLSRRALSGEPLKVGGRGKKARRKAGKRQRQARKLARR